MTRARLVCSEQTCYDELERNGENLVHDDLIATSSRPRRESVKKLTDEQLLSLVHPKKDKGLERSEA